MTSARRKRIPADDVPYGEAPLTMSEVLGMGLAAAAGRSALAKGDIVDGAYLYADLAGLGCCVERGASPGGQRAKEAALAQALAFSRRHSEIEPRDRTDAERVYGVLTELGHDVRLGGSVG